jgi:hypothetical protein
MAGSSKTIVINDIPVSGLYDVLCGVGNKGYVG